ncbi:hypothetical protein [Dulcicalothrix desertica]|nr:hypothetical protein [Dulcicalothrix desertica]TWH62574.1 hypothetical protein CAL7102_00067 [Dulcicalothrix desertica PCC 7102]
MISQNITVGTSISAPATSDVVIPQVPQAPIPAGYITEISLLVTAVTPLILGLRKKDKDKNDDKEDDDKSN